MHFSQFWQLFQLPSWRLEALLFVDDEPGRAAALFSLNEDGYDFIYVEYVVELEHGQVVSANARTG